MKRKWYVAGSASVGLLMAGVWLAVGLRDRAAALSQPSPEIALKCSIVEGASFKVSIAMQKRTVRFEGGPEIPIHSTKTDGDALSIEARSDTYSIISRLGRTPSIAFGEVGSVPQSTTCVHIDASQARLGGHWE